MLSEKISSTLCKGGCWSETLGLLPTSRSMCLLPYVFEAGTSMHGEDGITCADYVRCPHQPYACMLAKLFEHGHSTRFEGGLGTCLGIPAHCTELAHTMAQACRVMPRARESSQ